MTIIEPHIHMFSRTTDEYQAMYRSGIRACVEPSFWLGANREYAGSFFDYFKVILRTRSGNSGKHVGQCEASELKAIGFWLEHRSDYLEEFSTDYCQSVEYIEQQTGFTFFPSVPDEVKKQCAPPEWNL